MAPFQSGGGRRRSLTRLPVTRIQLGFWCCLVLGYNLFSLFIAILFFLMPLARPSSVLAPAKDNIGRGGQQEILPHLVLVGSINMKKWLYGE